MSFLSWTNRLFDKGKLYGQIVTFQSPNHFKKIVDDVLKLYSMGGTGETVVQEWGAVKKEFIRNLAVSRYADAHLGMIHFLCLEQRGFSLYNKTIAERV